MTDFITTTADKLYFLLQNYPSLKVKELSTLLSQHPDTIEKMCLVLERKGLVSVSYNLFADTTVRLNKEGLK